MLTLINNHYNLPALHYPIPEGDMPAFASLDDHAYPLHNYVIAVLSDFWPEIELGEPKNLRRTLVARLPSVDPTNRSITGVRIYGSV